MENRHKLLEYIQLVVNNSPEDWLKLTTHRLDIYEEKLAKEQFLDQFETLFNQDNSSTEALQALPTAFDYIRLGHPLSCILEWTISKLHSLMPNQVISFSSRTIPVLAILRKNLFEGKNTRLLYSGDLPQIFEGDLLNRIYNYNFELLKVDNLENLPEFDGSSVLLSETESNFNFELHPSIDFLISFAPKLGSVLCVNGEQNNNYISEIQHVRRRETIAMTPINSLTVLNQLTAKEGLPNQADDSEEHKNRVRTTVREITGTTCQPLIGSSGLSIQYAIMMGLVHEATEKYPEKAIKIIVPPNCYGGTNDQARRVAACNNNIEVLDLPVDGGKDMVQGIELVLEKVAQENAVPYIIAEIPTNPRVEVPDLIKLEAALSKERMTPSGEKAVAPVFILDQTFCPNVHFLGEKDILSSVQAIAYVSGSKFPSGGKCTAGYCVANAKSAHLLEKIDLHLQLCENEATDHQLEVLSEQLPSMLQRIEGAYANTRDFVNFIEEHLPEAKINFVSEELANEGFKPSVFSLDLPTKGNTDEERETYKRALNLKLIHLMIDEIPSESKFCVSYGQLKGCYWTVPATSTQGTTKEGDKDYIVRVALAPELDLEQHKEVFLEFVNEL